MDSKPYRIVALPSALKPRTGLLLFWLAGLFLVPLFPLSNFVGHPHWDAIRWIPFQDFSLTLNTLVDVIGNIVWFLVFGYLLQYWREKDSSLLRTITTTVLIASGVSLTLEFFQVFCHNRTPSMTDVVCNAIGASLGAYLAKRHRASIASEPVRYMVIEEDGSRTLL